LVGPRQSLHYKSTGGHEIVHTEHIDLKHRGSEGSSRPQYWHTPHTFPDAAGSEELPDGLPIAVELTTPTVVVAPKAFIAAGTGLTPNKPVDLRSHEVKAAEAHIVSGMNPARLGLAERESVESDEGSAGGGEV
jgi:hypothetical protein